MTFLVKYKEKRKIIDYTDMLVKCLEKKTFPKLRILFVDEAQDLSKVQWDIINEIGKETVKIIAENGCRDITMLSPLHSSTMSRNGFLFFNRNISNIFNMVK